MTLEKITFDTKLNENVKNSDLIIEAATESKSIKIQIFKQLDLLCSPKTILASNTSSISITEIANSTNRPEKVIGMHWGTFVLSLEPIMEPPLRFKNNAEKYGFTKDDALILSLIHI